MSCYSFLRIGMSKCCIKIPTLRGGWGGVVKMAVSNQLLPKPHNKIRHTIMLVIVISQKMTPSSETEIFFGDGSDGKVVAPGIVVICSINKNRDHYTKNWLLAPNIQILGSKKHIFAPSGQFEPHRSMFSTRKRCLIGIPIWGYQNFYSLPPKSWDVTPVTHWHTCESKAVFCLGRIRKKKISSTRLTFNNHKISIHQMFLLLCLTKFCTAAIYSSSSSLVLVLRVLLL